jgi:hypothetical protein
MGFETMPINNQEDNEEKGDGAKNALENLQKKLKEREENKDQSPKEDILDEYGDFKPEYVKGLKAEEDEEDNTKEQ